MLRHQKYAWVLAILLAIPLWAIGARAAQQQGGEQQQGGGEEEPKEEVERQGPMTLDDRLALMTKQFNLTDAQQSKIKPILADSQKKMDDLRNNSSNNRIAMRAKVMQIMQDTNKLIRAQLDDKQREKLDKQEAERMARMQNRHRNGPGGDNPDPPPAPKN
jgi:Spy/CpxP family protein refolding chaperone